MQNTREKYIRFVLCFVFLFLGFVSMSVYPTSYSIFIDENNTALVYGTKLYQLYQGLLDLNFDTTSTYKTLRMDFNLPRNVIAKENETDLYTIELSKNCEVVTHGLTILESSTNANRYQMRFGANEASKKIQFACNVPVNTSGVQPVDVIVKVNEQIGNEQSFLYKEGSYHMDNYYNLRSLPEIEYTLKEFVMPLDAKGKYSSFEKWIADYLDTVLTKSSDKKMVKDYVKTVYNSDATLINKSLSLMGIVMTPNEEKGIYTYRIEDNLVGYAKTKKAVSPRYMYFTTQDKKELDKAFQYYLGVYLKNENDFQAVLNYLNHFSQGQGISYLLLPNEDGSYNSISGFDPYYDDNELVLDEALLEYAYSYQLNKIQLSYLDYEEDRQVSFKVSFRNVYGSIISQEMKDKLVSPDSLVLQSAIQIDQDQFHDYFLEYDAAKKQYLYIEVYRKAGESYNYVEIQVIPEIENMTLSMLNDAGSVKILVANATVAELSSFVAQLGENETFVVDGPNSSESSISVHGASFADLVKLLDDLQIYLEAMNVSETTVSKEDEFQTESMDEIMIKE